MGCDIHAAVEYRRGERTEGNDEWWVHAIDAHCLCRDYAFFSCLVDGHPRHSYGIVGVAPARDLPPLPSDITRDVLNYRERHDSEYVGNAVCGASHTFSWLAPEEYRKAIALYETYGTTKTWGPLDAAYYALACYMDRLAEADPVRLVFGFDS